MVTPATMDLFQHRYYRLNKTMMTLIGQWPYQSTLARGVFLAVLVFLSTSQVVPLILALVKYRRDWRILLECAVPTLFYAVIAIKLFGFMWYSPKVSSVVANCTATSRLIPAGALTTLDTPTDITWLLTLRNLHTVMFVNVLIFVSQPIVPKIIDVVLSNGTESGQLPFPGYYYDLDVQKYYFWIVTYCYVCVFMMTMVSITSDVMLIIYVQHACGLFGALGHKLERIGNNDTSMETRDDPRVSDKRGMANLAPCIDRHNDAIEYAAMIEATYSWPLLFVVGFGMILINAIGLQILMNTDDLAAMPRLVFFALCIMLHFYIDCYICQTLMDHSTSIHFCIHNSQWYKLSTKVQKALQLMAMRCNAPCELTAGNFFIISLRTYGLTFKAAISYFAVARSMQAT